MPVNDLFFRANYRCRQRAYQRWQRGEAKRHILRAQLGFADGCSTRPKACIGCQHYHGHAYGWQKDRRTLLVCAMHPFGWQSALPCPDWCGESAIAPPN